MTSEVFTQEFFLFNNVDCQAFRSVLNPFWWSNSLPSLNDSTPTQRSATETPNWKRNSIRDEIHLTSQTAELEHLSRFFSANFCLFRFYLDFLLQTLFPTYAFWKAREKFFAAAPIHFKNSTCYKLGSVVPKPCEKNELKLKKSSSLLCFICLLPLVEKTIQAWVESEKGN